MSNDQSSVVCRLCGKSFRKMNHTHLKMHGYTVASYRAEFPDAPLVCDTTKQLMSDGWAETHAGVGQKVADAQRGVKHSPARVEKMASCRWKENRTKKRDFKCVVCGKPFTRWITDSILNSRDCPQCCSSECGRYLSGKITGLMMRDRPKSEQHKLAISATVLLYYTTHDGPRKGVEVLVETRLRMSQSALNRSPEHNRANSEGQKRWCLAHPKEMDDRMSYARSFGRFWNTKPERILISLVEELGLSCVPQGRLLQLSRPYKFHRFDAVLTDFNIGLEAEGCYWHACPECAIEISTSQKEQIAAQVERDQAIDHMVEGIPEIDVLRFWEHDLLNHPGRVRECIRRAVEPQGVHA